MMPWQAASLHLPASYMLDNGGVVGHNLVLIGLTNLGTEAYEDWF